MCGHYSRADSIQVRKLIKEYEYIPYSTQYHAIFITRTMCAIQLSYERSYLILCCKIVLPWQQLICFMAIITCQLVCCCWCVFTCSPYLDSVQDGATALYVAAYNGHLRVVELLIAAKAQVDFQRVRK